MRIVRYLNSAGQTQFGAEVDGRVMELTGAIFDRPQVTTRPADVRKLLAPIDPRAIFCIGLNYRKHAEETKAKIPEFPVLFMKSPAAVQNPGDPIVLPRSLRSDEVDYECELAVVIGKPGQNISRERALEHVLGYTCANDVSARDWQKKWGGGQWCRGKTFDTFCPLGPVIVTPDELGNPAGLGIRTIINGDVLQEGRTDDLIFDIPGLISFLSGSTTLLPGTVILTGTPHGVGMARQPQRWLRPGDEVIIEIDRIGRLSNPVTEEIIAGSP